MSEILSATTIDFLPAHYHERTRKNRADLWRLLVVAMLGGIVAATALSVHQIRRQAVHELAHAESLHGNTTSTNTKLAELQARLQPLQTRAELLTYLRYPWPRTQILSGVLSALPPSITLTRLHIVRENLDKSAPSQQAVRPVAKTATPGKEPEELSDLQRLRADCDKLKWVVILAGSVTESPALYEYLGQLGDQGLFSRVELGPVERSGNDSEAARFSARLTVRPGYGQPGGPAPTPAGKTGSSVARNGQNGGRP